MIPNMGVYGLSRIHVSPYAGLLKAVQPEERRRVSTLGSPVIVEIHTQLRFLGSMYLIFH